jgi:HEPN/RES N-terminal domain 1/RES domain
MGHYSDEFYFSGSDEFVCGGCFDDADIAEFVESDAVSQECNFCGEKSDMPIAAPLDHVVQFMSNAINREYERAVDALGWSSEDGGYLGYHFDSYELLEDEIGLALPRDDGRLLKVLAKCLGDQPWCQRDPYGMTQDELLISSWNHFSRFIKHQRRYFFLQEHSNALDRSHLTASQMLLFVSRSAEDYGLVKTLPAGTLIYRARQMRSGDRFASPYDFGPPPFEHAVKSNRMSPAGIVMFYGSQDTETAIAEIDDNPQLGICVAIFRAMRDSLILDLTALPRRLRFFEEQSDSSEVNRYALNFLHEFVKDMAAKVEPGEREHIDYIPTQVVTEYFRTTFRHGETLIDGVRYSSAQRTAGKSIVLFADQSDVVLNSVQIKTLVATGRHQDWQLRDRQERAWLELVEGKVVRLPQATEPHGAAAT